ncbi:MAG: SCP2 sterol-binding domain-containing protein [Anaerolineales bacterium]|nr:SCP2 sterol-binding domain-containing protein [Anaerolineales bacterium]
MHKATTIDQLLSDMSRRWLPEKSAGIHATIQLDLSGAEPRQTSFMVADGALAIQPGPTGSPNLTLTASAEDYLAISNGELDPVKAFMQGRLKAKGDLGLALKFQSMFDFELE